MNFFANIAAAAQTALHAFYQSLFSQALSTSADELSEWNTIDSVELEMEDGVVIYAKRLALPIWDLVDPEYASEIASDLMLETESKYPGMHLCSYTGDGEFVVYITNVDADLDLLRLAYDDLEEEEEEEELHAPVEVDAQRQPESGRVLNMVPRIGHPAPSSVVEEDFPEEPEMDFPEEQAPVAAPVTAQAAPAELADAEPVAETPAPIETPVNEPQAAPATNAEADALAGALNGEPAQPLYAQEPLTTDETLAVINARSDQQPEPETVVDTGPVKESAELLAVIHAEKMQALIGMLPSDTMTDIVDGVLTLMYARDVEGENVDYIRVIRLVNENFQNLRFVDIFYVEDENGVALHRAMNAASVLQHLENIAQ